MVLMKTFTKIFSPTCRFVQFIIASTFQQCIFWKYENKRTIEIMNPFYYHPLAFDTFLKKILLTFKT